MGPLLFLVYINELPNCLNYSTPRMFADDTSVSYASNSANELQNVINLELKSLNSWLIANKLSLNIAKSEFMTIGSRQKMATINDEIAIKINDHDIKRVTTVNAIGTHACVAS